MFVYSFSYLILFSTAMNPQFIPSKKFHPQFIWKLIHHDQSFFMRSGMDWEFIDLKN